MYVYDKAHELAKALAVCSEYKEFKEAKEKVDSIPKAKEMLNDFKKKQFELHNLQLMGQNVNEQQMQQIQALYQVIILNPDIAQYLSAEIKFSQMFSDVYKIITEAVDLNLNFLK
ncbi:MAG: YlbF family regulator [Bacillota bacterium]